MVDSAVGIRIITKRDGREVRFDREKIVTAIMKAAQSVAGSDRNVAQALTDQVLERLGQLSPEHTPSVELTQDIIEKVLIENGHARTAKAFILHRAKRSRIREGKSELMDLVADIMQPEEDPGLSLSPPLAVGLAASRQFTLNRILTETDAEAHHRGLWHIHDLARYGQMARALVLIPDKVFQDGLRAGAVTLERPVNLDQATDWLRLLLAQAKERGYADTILHHLDQALAPFARDASDVELTRCVRALLLACNAYAMPGRVHLRLSDAHETDAQRVALTVLRVWASLQEQAAQPIQPRLVLEWSRPFDDARADARINAAVTHAAQWGHITFEKGLLPDGYSASALLSLNMPRIALEAKAGQRSLKSALEEVIHRACVLLKDQHNRVLAQAERNPLATFAPPHRPAALSLTGFAAALLVSDDAHPDPLAQAETLLKLAASGVARHTTPDGWGVVLTNHHSATVSAAFAKQDRRAFGILRGVTDGSAYDGNLIKMPPHRRDPVFWSSLGQLGDHLSGGHIVYCPHTPDLTPAACLESLEAAWDSPVHGVQF